MERGARPAHRLRRRSRTDKSSPRGYLHAEVAPWPRLPRWTNALTSRFPQSWTVNVKNGRLRPFEILGDFSWMGPATGKQGSEHVAQLAKQYRALGDEEA